MNIDKLTEIAEWLEAGAPERHGVAKFDMTGYVETHSECGTACCIAGAAIQFNQDVPFKSYLEFNGVEEDPASEGADILGLDYDLAECLFLGYNSPGPGDVNLRSITPAWAARCIRKLIATGEVDWIGTQDA